MATICVLVAQTIGVIWWAATLGARVEYLDRARIEAAISQTAVDRRQDEEQKRAEERVLGQLDKLNVKMDRLIEERRPR